MIGDLSSPPSQRSVVEKTIRTYPNEWIVIHECMQNALDAVAISGKERGQIKVVMNLDEEAVEIRDNGIGFPFDLSLLGFGASSKSSDNWNIGGEIGVGLKVVIMSSKEFTLAATYRKQGKLRRWVCQIKDGYKYPRGLSDDVEVCYAEPVTVEGTDTGTTVRYSFPEDRVGRFVETLYDNYIRQNLIHDDLASTIEGKFKITCLKRNNQYPQT
jgi:DNA topoisomerase VI subunit B